MFIFYGLIFYTILGNYGVNYTLAGQVLLQPCLDMQATAATSIITQTISTVTNRSELFHYILGKAVKLNHFYATKAKGFIAVGNSSVTCGCCSSPPPCGGLPGGLGGDKLLAAGSELWLGSEVKGTSSFLY